MQLGMLCFDYPWTLFKSTKWSHEFPQPFGDVIEIYGRQHVCNRPFFRVLITWHWNAKKKANLMALTRCAQVLLAALVLVAQNPITPTSYNCQHARYRNLIIKLTHHIACQYNISFFCCYRLGVMNNFAMVCGMCSRQLALAILQTFYT